MIQDRRVLWLAALALPLLWACAEEEPSQPPVAATLPPLEIPEGCNPLAADVDCLLPFPSDAFLVADPALPSGRRVAYGGAGPRSAGGPGGLDDGGDQADGDDQADGGDQADGVFDGDDQADGVIDITAVYPADGFSVASPILALFPEGVDPAGLVAHDGDTRASLSPESATLILKVEKSLDGGEPPSVEVVEHFAELDPRAASDAGRALILRPLGRLDNGARYVVAIQRLRTPAGAAVSAPEGFRRLRDAQAAGDPVLAPLSARYEAEIFPALQAAGVDRGGLLLAWDFTTGTLEQATADMLKVRAEVMARFDDRSPEVTIEEVEEEVNAHIARRITGTITAPLFIEDDKPNARLNRDGAGQVEARGEVAVPFTILVPRSVMAAQGPARLMQYGHGFLGGREEIDGDFVAEMSDQIGVVVIAMDWWGMSNADVFPLGEKLTQAPSEALVFTDRLHQAMANFIAATFAARGALLDAPALQREGGAPLYDPDQIVFYGISQGHILGATYAALSPHISRIVLGVGGASFTLMMFRALPFKPFIYLIELQIADPLDQQKWAAMTQTGFDRVDPISYAPLLLDAPLPESPPDRRVLMQVGIGDTSVPNLASHLHARALGLRLLDPAARPIPGLELVAAPFEGSALVEFDFKIDPPLGTAADFPEARNEVHEGVRRLPSAIRQMDRFLNVDSRIENFCQGACDPE